MVNQTLPWDYEFRFVIEEISNINDKAQVRPYNPGMYSCFHENGFFSVYFFKEHNLYIPIADGTVFRKHTV